MTIVHPLVEGRTTKLTLKKNRPEKKKKKLKRINIKQEDVARIIFNEDRLCHSPPLSKTLDALSIYQLNIYQNFSFVPRLKSNNIPKIFTELIKKPKHKYPSFQKAAIYENHSLYAISSIVLRFEEQSYVMNFCKAKKRKSNPSHFSKKV